MDPISILLIRSNLEDFRLFHCQKLKSDPKSKIELRRWLIIWMEITRKVSYLVSNYFFQNISICYFFAFYFFHEQSKLHSQKHKISPNSGNSIRDHFSVGNSLLKSSVRLGQLSKKISSPPSETVIETIYGFVRYPIKN